MKTRSRSTLALLLAGLGASGLILAAAGALPGAPAWCWLVVLALGVLAHLGVEHARSQARVDKKTARRISQLEAQAALVGDGLSAELCDLRERLDRVGTPEGMAAFREVVQKMANDIRPVVEAFNSGRLASALKGTIKP